MKVAHLLTVHKNPTQLLRLINQLNVMDCDIYIHVDKKYNRENFNLLNEISNVFFIKNRVDVKWGGYSQVQATLNSLEEILNSGKQYNYVNFISGQDYPIKPMRQFYDFLTVNNGNEFLEFIHAEERAEVTRKRIYKYNLNDFTFKGRFFVQKIINLILPEKKFPLPNYSIVWKANWFTITPAAANYVVEFLKSHPKVVKFFKYGWGVDEFVFQTLLYNSEFKNNIVNNNYRYVDWSAALPSPKTLLIDDFEKIARSDKFFARKFDESVDAEILNKIDLELLKN